MSLTLLDWAIVLAYFALSIGIGLKFTKKGGEIARGVLRRRPRRPWWLAGSAMVATTFAADTPLVVTGLVASARRRRQLALVEHGHERDAHRVLLRAALAAGGVMTDVEFAEIRYSGRPATFLRGFRALYLALPINLIIMGWVTLAMVKILGIALGISPDLGGRHLLRHHRRLLGRRRDVGGPLDRPRPVRHQDDGGHRPRGLRRRGRSAGWAR